MTNFVYLQSSKILTRNVALVEALAGDLLCQVIQVMRCRLFVHSRLDQVCLRCLPRQLLSAARYSPGTAGAA
jgi:hypothetical protein